MAQTNPIALTLLALHANQVRRVRFALDDMRDEVFAAEPGGDCNSIRQIGQHLVGLHKFMLSLLGSPLGKQIEEDVSSPAALQRSLSAAASLLEQAIREHDEADWLAEPAEPREGPWGDEATLYRLTRPFNDLTNHIGAIRAIRRQLGNPAGATQ